jgi:hypothetical protein
MLAFIVLTFDLPRRQAAREEFFPVNDRSALNYNFSADSFEC